MLDQRVLEAASRALGELPPRVRDVLSHLLLEGGSVQTVALRHGVTSDRAGDWVEEARQRFVDRLEVQLRRRGLGDEEIRASLAQADAIARELMPLVARTVTSTDLRIGEYTLGEPLGAGGMGVVYRAHHATLGRAAVKLLRGEWIRDARVVDRLFREARAARMVQHPGVVTIYECGHHGDTPYIAMELLQGSSLGTRLRERGCFAVDDAVRIVRQTASVLAAAHAVGVAHRDLKPDNIFLVPDGEVAGGERVKILDFGIAKLAGSGDSKLTHARDVIGSPAYMAPEQCEGAGTVDTRVDVYSLGCTLFELLAGRPPFLGSTERVLVAQMDEAPPAIGTFAPGVPAELVALIDDMLAKDPARRAPIAVVVERLRALEADAGGSHVDGPIAAARSINGNVRRGRRLGVLASILLVVGGALAATAPGQGEDVVHVVDRVARELRERAVRPQDDRRTGPATEKTTTTAGGGHPAIDPHARTVVGDLAARLREEADVPATTDTRARDKTLREQAARERSARDRAAREEQAREARALAEAKGDADAALVRWRERVGTEVPDELRRRVASATTRTAYRALVPIIDAAIADAVRARQVADEARRTAEQATSAGREAKAAGDALATAETLVVRFRDQRDLSVQVGVAGFELALAKIASGKQAQTAGKHVEARALFVQATSTLRDAIASHASVIGRRQCIQHDCEPKFQTCERRDVEPTRARCERYTFDVAKRSCERTLQILDDGCRDLRQICIDYCNRRF